MGKIYFKEAVIEDLDLVARNSVRECLNTLDLVDIPKKDKEYLRSSILGNFNSYHRYAKNRIKNIMDDNS